MRILQVHNYYRQRGGEDQSAEQDYELLSKNGYDVKAYTRCNQEIRENNLILKTGLFFTPTWSCKTYKEITQILKSYKPDIVHVQNSFPLVSPSIYYACHANNVPVVQTLHNYRMFCANGLFLRNGTVCELCLNKSLLNAIRYRCYRNSMIQTISVVLMLVLHRLLKTWQNKIDGYIALSDFSRNKYIEGCIPENKLHLHHNFQYGNPMVDEKRENYVVFVGRLSVEKGVTTLLEAFSFVKDIHLKIIGEGPLSSWISEFIKNKRMLNVELLGYKLHTEVMMYIKKARLLVIPSLFYETFGRTIIEAYSVGVPVIASRLGAMAELVQDSKTGYLFTPGNPTDLVDKIHLALDNNKWKDLSITARKVFEEKYNENFALTSLINIYHDVIENYRSSDQLILD